MQIKASKIRRVTFEGVCHDEDLAQSLQDRIIINFNSYLQPILDNHLGNFAKNSLLKIQTLELDLGKLTINDINNNLPELFERKLKEYLQNLRRELDLGIYSYGIEEDSYEEHILDFLYHYFKEGFIPWNLQEFGDSQRVMYWINYLADKSPYLLYKLTHLFEEDDPRKRLVALIGNDKDGQALQEKIYPKEYFQFTGQFNSLLIKVVNNLSVVNIGVAQFVDSHFRVWLGAVLFNSKQTNLTGALLSQYLLRFIGEKTTLNELHVIFPILESKQGEVLNWEERQFYKHMEDVFTETVGLRYHVSKLQKKISLYGHLTKQNFINYLEKNYKAYARYIEKIDEKLISLIIEYYSHEEHLKVEGLIHELVIDTLQNIQLPQDMNEWLANILEEVLWVFGLNVHKKTKEFILQEQHIQQKERASQHLEGEDKLHQQDTGEGEHEHAQEKRPPRGQKQQPEPEGDMKLKGDEEREKVKEEQVSPQPGEVAGALTEKDQLEKSTANIASPDGEISFLVEKPFITIVDNQTSIKIDVQQAFSLFNLWKDYGLNSLKRLLVNPIHVMVETIEWLAEKQQVTYRKIVQTVKEQKGELWKYFIKQDMPPQFVAHFINPEEPSIHLGRALFIEVLIQNEIPVRHAHKLGINEISRELTDFVNEDPQSAAILLEQHLIKRTAENKRKVLTYLNPLLDTHGFELVQSKVLDKVTIQSTVNLPDRLSFLSWLHYVNKRTVNKEEAVPFVQYVEKMVDTRDKEFAELLIILPKQEHEFIYNILKPTYSQRIKAMLRAYELKYKPHSPEEEDEIQADKKEDTYRRFEEGEVIFVRNAGMVLLNPYISMLFQRLKLIDGKKFIDEKKKIKAMQVLQYICTKDVKPEEHDLVLNKVIVGYELQQPIEQYFELTKEELDLCDGLLDAILKNWSALKNTSKDNLRASFLIRNGKLIREHGNWRLIIEQKSIDVLLDKLPWTYGMTKLPWMEIPLMTDWR